MKIEDKITTFNTSNLMPTAKSNWFNFILANMLAIVVVALGLFAPLLSFALAFIAMAYMQVGVYGFVLRSFRGQKPDFESLFLPFKSILKILIIIIIALCGMIVWGLLLIVPGVIYGLNNSFAALVYFDNPELTTKEIFEKSKKLTYGYRFTILITVLGMIALVCSGASIGVGIYFIFTLFMKVPTWLSVMLIALPAVIVLATLALPLFESFLVQMYETSKNAPEKSEEKPKPTKTTPKKVSNSKQM